ncbi:MAG: energy-coupled thiamine transporter ThiT [Ruminococcus sp.]|nr:energy-coupled thiamine transporter ThiT [Ruminococcus sp.]
MSQHDKIVRLTASGIMIALSTVLSMIKLIPMPQGGALTPCSMLPVCMISIIYGVKWGLGTGFAYSLVQLAIDFSAALSWGISAKALAVSFACDYIIAFTVLGLAGLFRNQPKWGIGVGITIVFLLKYASHVFSGAVAFGQFMPEEFSNVWIYSLAYNTYMLPELIPTIIIAYFLCKVPSLSRLKTA